MMTTPILRTTRLSVVLSILRVDFTVRPIHDRPIECPNPAAVASEKKVILDTDIGDDIDDAFALALALPSPELKILGITTAWGDTNLRARLVDRFLMETGHAEIPVAEGSRRRVLLLSLRRGGLRRAKLSVGTRRRSTLSWSS